MRKDIGIWVVRVFGTILLGSYTFYAVQTKIIKEQEVDLNGDDWLLLGGSVAVWVAAEAFVAGIKRIANRKSED